MKYLCALAAIVSAVAATGCLVHIEHVSNPERHFRAAMDEAERYQGRPGPARELNVLTYDPSGGELVRVSLPLWLVGGIARRVDFDDLHLDIDEDLDETEARVARSLKRRFRRGDLRELEALPLGIVASVDDADGERVLVWMK